MHVSSTSKFSLSRVNDYPQSSSNSSCLLSPPCSTRQILRNSGALYITDTCRKENRSQSPKPKKNETGKVGDNSTNLATNK